MWRLKEDEWRKDTEPEEEGAKRRLAAEEAAAADRAD